METIGMLKAKLLNEKIRQLQMRMGYAQISSDKDPRSAAIRLYNRQMAALTNEERNALLDEWGY